MGAVKIIKYEMIWRVCILISATNQNNKRKHKENQVRNYLLHKSKVYLSLSIILRITYNLCRYLFPNCSLIFIVYAYIFSCLWPIMRSHFIFHREWRQERKTLLEPSLSHFFAVYGSVKKWWWRWRTPSWSIAGTIQIMLLKIKIKVTWYIYTYCYEDEYKWRGKLLKSLRKSFILAKSV